MNEQTPYTNNNEVYTETANTQPQQVTYAQPLTQPENKLWQVFANVSYIMGIVCMICAFVPYVDVVSSEVAIIGIVLGALGMKSPSLKDKAKNGMIFNIIAIAASIIIACIYIFIFIGLFAGFSFLSYTA